MIRLLLFLAALALAAYGLTWLAENPGEVALTWRGVEYDVSLMVALGVVSALAILLRSPGASSVSSSAFPRWFRSRPRRAGGKRATPRFPAAWSRSARATRARRAGTPPKRASIWATSRWRNCCARRPRNLRATARARSPRSARCSSIRKPMRWGFAACISRRGAAATTRRRWSSRRAPTSTPRCLGRRQAVLDDRAAHGDWAGALAIVESNAAARLIDKPTANRWRAVLKTAMAQELAERDAERRAGARAGGCALAPGLVPAAALCGRLTAAARRLSPRRENHRDGVSADAASRSRRRLSQAAARRFGGGPAGARARAGAPRAVRFGKPDHRRPRGARGARPRRGARGARAAAGVGRSGRPPDRARLPADGRHRGGGGRRRRGARMARPRRARAARSRLGRRRGDQRSLGAGVALGRARRLRLAHARRAPERAGAVAARLRRPPASRPRRRVARRAARGCAARPIAAAPEPEPPPRRNVVLLPSSAPDDPGPHEESERKPGFRLFARD